MRVHSLILIGASTGGPSHIQNILLSLPKDFKSSIIIAQHMGDDFIETFAKHMNDSTHLNVFEAKDELMLEASTVYVCSKLCKIIKSENEYHFSVNDAMANDYNPNINELFLSCCKFTDTLDTLALILTGIGDDGALGMKALCQTKAKCISESEASAIVYGMPQRASEVSPLVKSQSLGTIIETIKVFGV